MRVVEVAYFSRSCESRVASCELAVRAEVAVAS